ncbi:hypothetical protein Tco_0781730 [Tanacetum coccineum]
MSRSETIRLPDKSQHVSRSHVAKDGTSGSGPNTKNQNLEKAKKRKPKKKCELIKLRKVNAHCPICDDGGFNCELCESLWNSELVALEKIEYEIEEKKQAARRAIQPMLDPELPFDIPQIESASKLRDAIAAKIWNECS